MTADPALRFRERDHAYFVGDRRIPSITQMLERAGVTDYDWATEESAERGHAVHQLTAAWDLDGMTRADVEQLTSPYRGWLLAHIAACDVVRPVWQIVEVALVSRRHGFAGRADRFGQLYQIGSVVEVKSGAKARGHMIQTALQALLLGPVVGLQPEVMKRYGWYLQRTGRFQIEEFKDRRDFDEARRIARAYGVGALA